MAREISPWRELWDETTAIALAVLAAWLVPSVASAHPLGNFTVNHYTRIDAGRRTPCACVYVLDMAEIAALRERPRIDAAATVP